MHEVGIIEHEGNRYAADGATCDGHHLECYTQRHTDGTVDLTNWHGATLATLRYAAGRSLRLQYGEEMDILALRCGRGRWIVGCSLGDGMLFRGESLIGDYDESDALRIAEQIGEYFAELDSEDDCCDD